MNRNPCISQWLIFGRVKHNEVETLESLTKVQLADCLALKTHIQVALYRVSRLHIEDMI